MAWLLMSRLVCLSVYALGAALSFLCLLELFTKPMDQFGHGFAVTVILAQSIKVLVECILRLLTR